MVYHLIIRKVKSAFKRVFFQLGGINICGEGLRLVQGFLVEYVQFIDENHRAKIAVAGNRINAVFNHFAALEVFDLTNCFRYSVVVVLPLSICLH